MNLLKVVLILVILPNATLKGPVPSKTWTPSASTVAIRIKELNAFYQAYDNDEESLDKENMVMKDLVAKKTKAPEWIKKSSWLDTAGTTKVRFGVGLCPLISNLMLSYFTAENRARSEIAKLENVTVEKQAVAGGTVTKTFTATTLTGVELVDWYIDNKMVYALAVQVIQ